MSRKTIPDDLRRFILTSVPSVPYLEALLLLHADRARSWDSFTVAARLYTGEVQALGLLQSMQQAGMCARLEDGRFVYAPVTPDLERIVDALAVTYSQDLVGVTDLIHSRVEKRAQQFADAFRWKKDEG